MKKLFKLGVVGCGNMATAIILGAIKNNGVLKGSDIIVYDSDFDKANAFAKRIGATVAQSNNALAFSAKYVLIAVKPQSFKDISNELCGAGYVISIMAGIKTNSILESISGLHGMARIMPNAPAMVNKGMSALYFVNSTNEDKVFVTNLFSSIGKTVELDESKFDAVTAISGSGPAYIYYFIKSMIDAGVKLGLSIDESRTLTYQTFLGATEFSLQSDLCLDNLIDMVCSKGGTTIEAITSFKNSNTDKIIEEAILKCFNRSKELSGDK